MHQQLLQVVLQSVQQCYGRSTLPCFCRGGIMDHGRDRAVTKHAECAVQKHSNKHNSVEHVHFVHHQSSASSSSSPPLSVAC